MVYVCLQGRFRLLMGMSMHPRLGPPSTMSHVCFISQPRTLTSIYNEDKQRVEDCWTQSEAMQSCKDLAEELHQALEKAQLEDLRPNAAGEKSRIYSRALAMKRVLEKVDPGLAPETATYATDDPVTAHDPSKLTTRQHTNKQMRIQRSSNEAEPDATPDQCVMSVCLLMAALYEQTPFTQGDVRKRIYHDFTLLKRHFRQDELVTLHGRSGAVRDLFDSIKELDKRGGLQNLIGIRFEDWKVFDRVSKFIMAEELEAQVSMHCAQCHVLQREGCNWVWHVVMRHCC